eukprot:Opistho-2@86722
MASDGDRYPKQVFQHQSEPFGDKLRRKFSENPFVPIGLVITAATLVIGLRAMNNNDKRTSQFMMRARVLAQGLTVGAAVVGMVYFPSSRLRNQQNPDAQSRMGDIDATK